MEVVVVDSEEVVEFEEEMLEEEVLVEEVAAADAVDVNLAFVAVPLATVGC